VWQIVATNGTTIRKEQKMSNKWTSEEKLGFGFICVVIFVISTFTYNLGVKHGRNQVHFQEVECVDHPLQNGLVLCSRTRETVELEIEWKS